MFRVGTSGRSVPTSVVIARRYVTRKSRIHRNEKNSAPKAVSADSVAKNPSPPPERSKEASFAGLPKPIPKIRAPSSPRVARVPVPPPPDKPQHVRLSCDDIRLVGRAWSLPDYPNPTEYPQPQVLVVGRTNAGKSSLLNHVFRGYKLAKTSSRPGVTISMDFYNVDNKVMFVDSPGFGDNLPVKSLKRWVEMMREYVSKAPLLKMVLLLHDITVPPALTERNILTILAARRDPVPILLVLTKDDKVDTEARHKELARIQRKLGWKGSLVHYSIRDRRGKGHLLRHVATTLFHPSESLLLKEGPDTYSAYAALGTRLRHSALHQHAGSLKAVKPPPARSATQAETPSAAATRALEATVGNEARQPAAQPASAAASVESIPAKAGTGTQTTWEEDWAREDAGLPPLARPTEDDDAEDTPPAPTAPTDEADRRRLKKQRKREARAKEFSVGFLPGVHSEAAAVAAAREAKVAKIRPATYVMPDTAGLTTSSAAGGKKTLRTTWETLPDKTPYSADQTWRKAPKRHRTRIKGTKADDKQPEDKRPSGAGAENARRFGKEPQLQDASA